MKKKAETAENILCSNMFTTSILYITLNIEIRQNKRAKRLF